MGKVNKRNSWSVLLLGLLILAMGLFISWWAPNGWNSLYTINVYGLWGWIFIISGAQLFILFIALKFKLVRSG